MPVRPARVGRVGVIGAPVAKTAVVAKAGLTVQRARHPGLAQDSRRRGGGHAWAPSDLSRPRRPISHRSGGR